VTQSILLVPFVLFVTLRYAVGSDLRDALGTAGLLVVAAAGFVLVHPQGALTVVLVLVTLAAAQAVVSRAGWSETVADHRSLALPAAIFTAAFGLWAPRFERVRRAVVGVTDNILGGAAPADEVARRSASLELLGGSVAELFVKLFAPSVVVLALTAVVGYALVRGRLDDRRPQRNALLGYLLLTTIPLGASFLVFFVSSVSTQHFRYIGFLTVPATILGAVALAEVGAEAFQWPSRRAVVAVGVGAFLILTPLAVATVHSSPFVYQPTSHVPESQFEGYEAAFDHRVESVAYTGVRSGPRRFLHATYGTERAIEMAVPGDRDRVPGPVFARNLTTYYDEARYLPVSQRDYEREVSLYRGFRYPQRGFERLNESPRVDRVVANDGVRLYLLGNATGGPA
jgi:hypothetical protein